MNKNKSCDKCDGYGLWFNDPKSPMGPIDASDGIPTIPCPKCKANANPIKKRKEKYET